jgi:hypothetical protein
MERLVDSLTISFVQRGILKTAFLALRDGDLWKTLSEADREALTNYSRNPDEATRVVMRIFPDTTAILEAKVSDLVVAHIIRSTNAGDEKTEHVKKLETREEVLQWLRLKKYPESRIDSVFQAYQLIAKEQTQESVDSIRDFFMDSTKDFIFREGEIVKKQAKESLLEIAIDPDIQSAVEQNITTILSNPQLSYSLATLVGNPAFVNATQKISDRVIQRAITQVSRPTSHHMPKHFLSVFSNPIHTFMFMV